MIRTFDAAGAIELGREVLLREAKAVTDLADTLDTGHFARAVELLLNCKGRVVVSGVGKSGHIGRKLAATLASTGTPAFFVHAAEAAHGDLGMITKDDVVIGISYSGETGELFNRHPGVKTRRHGPHHYYREPQEFAGQKRRRELKRARDGRGLPS